MGRNKLLLKVHGRRVLELVLSALSSSPVIEKVFVVLGHRPEDIRAIVEACGGESVFNRDYEEGMTSSFKAGLRSVSADAAFLVLGDQFGLESELLDKMVKLMESDRNILLVSPVFQGRRGHPVLFREPLFSEILKLSHEEMLKDVVSRHESEHGFVEGDVWCVTDIDTPEDFQNAKRMLESGRFALS